jgi:RsiW-degrading membrane proteinase PrsW (M82 family)
MSELQITSNGKTQTFQPGQIIRIGRSPDNNVVVSDPTVSREHARLVGTDDGWVFEDMGQDRTFVGGRPITRVAVGTQMEVRLATPDGPALLIRTGASVVPQRAPVREQPPQQAQPAAAAAAVPVPVLGRNVPAAEGLGAAINILVPVKSWLSDPGWRQWGRLLVIVYGLLPIIYLQLFANSTKFSTPGWAYSLYIAPLWAIAFWLLIRPGRITGQTVALAAGVIVTVLLLLPSLVTWWEGAVHTIWLISNNPPTVAVSHNLLTWIGGVGYPEETAKALPILLAALILRSQGKKLDARMWMFIGTIAGLTFGVAESIGYVSNALLDATKNSGDVISDILQFCERVFVDGFQHALWAGISAFFIGIGVNYRRRGIPIVLFGVTLPAVLHGLNDWSLVEFPNNQWVWIGIQTVSLLLFVGYTMSAASIDRQVRKTPMFRGQSMLLDPPSVVQPSST